MNGASVWCDLSILNWQARYVIEGLRATLSFSCIKEDGHFNTHIKTFLCIDPNALEKISTAVVFLQTAVRQTGLQLPNDFDRCASSLA